MNEFEPGVGRWALRGVHAIDGELPAVDGAIPAGAIEDWLFGDSIDLIAQAKPCTGFVASIDADGTFTEVAIGEAAIPWFDREGVMDEVAQPFDGILRPADGVAYLLLAEPISWATPVLPERLGRVRYDDGDTVICDKMVVAGGELVRTMSVVTDGLYLNRITLMYRRQP